MLLQFSCKNVLSFRNDTVLDLTAVQAYKEHESNCIVFGKNEKALRVATIYGANASGKSNLCDAMNIFRRIVLRSMNFDEKEGEKSFEIKRFYSPFSLEDNTGNSELQIVGVFDDYEYSYGFEYNSEIIVSEWFYIVNPETRRKIKVFERSFSEISFGRSYKKECDRYVGQIPNEALVLTFLNILKNQLDIFHNVYNDIKNMMIVKSDIRKSKELLKSVLPDLIDLDKKRLEDYLCAIDTGIKRIRYEKDEKDTKIFTAHQGRDGKEHELSLWFESDGTIKAIELFVYVYLAIEQNRILVIDELHNMLHPLLQKFVVDLFYLDDKSKAQLIYTTHDTTLLDKKFFRRDQIWFVQKDEYGCSSLVALSDYRVRSDSSFEKDYLAGVYGGIPLLKDYELKKGRGMNGLA